MLSFGIRIVKRLKLHQNRSYHRLMHSHCSKASSHVSLKRHQTFDCGDGRLSSDRPKMRLQRSPVGELVRNAVSASDAHAIAPSTPQDVIIQLSTSVSVWVSVSNGWCGFLWTQRPAWKGRGLEVDLAASPGTPPTSVRLDEQ
jgi:hypothetical protein